MKILNVLDVMNPVFGGGGGERSYQMSRYLAFAGENVDILTTNWNLDTEYTSKLKGINCYPVDAWYCRYLFPLGVKKWLMRNITNYDLIHLSKNWSLLSQIAGRVAANYNIPYVFSSMGFVAVHNRSQILKKFYRKYLTIPLIKKADACIAVTKEETIDLIDAGVSPEKVRLIPNGVILEDFLFKDNDHFRRYYKLDNRKIILFVGRMDPLKGVHLIIDAFEENRTKLDGWLLLLVGTKTNYRNEMERKVVKLNLQKNVLFLDPLFGRQKSEAYHAAEFLVVPSIKDAMTIVAPEAACCAKPVLLTKTSGFGELAQCGGAIEVEPSINGLSRGLTFLTSSHCDRVGMGKKGYDYVVKNYQWKQVAFKYRELFQAVLTSSKS